LGDLQLAVLRVLWSRAEASSSEVHAALCEERDLAPTTVATVLRRMEDRGLVTHLDRGRQFIFQPLVEEVDVREDMVGDLVLRMFKGDSRALVSHLIEAGEIDAEELDDLRARLAEKRGKK